MISLFFTRWFSIYTTLHLSGMFHSKISVCSMGKLHLTGIAVTEMNWKKKKKSEWWINGNRLCKLSCPRAFGLNTPWLPLSFTSSLHAHSTKWEIPDEQVHSSCGCVCVQWWLPAVELQNCIAWGQQIHLLKDLVICFEAPLQHAFFISHSPRRARSS